MDLTFFDSQIIIMHNVKTVFSSILSLSASYYNGFLCRWEPFIEKIGFDIDITYGANSNPKLYFVMQMNTNYEIFNINISHHMVLFFA
jgi:hypothetical protein